MTETQIHAIPTNSRSTALLLAAARGHSALVETLLTAGAQLSLEEQQQLRWHATYSLLQDWEYTRIRWDMVDRLCAYRRVSQVYVP